jgi:hypothetical protein
MTHPNRINRKLPNFFHLNLNLVLLELIYLFFFLYHSSQSCVLQLACLQNIIFLDKDFVEGELCFRIKIYIYRLHDISALLHEISALLHHPLRLIHVQKGIRELLMAAF